MLGRPVPDLHALLPAIHRIEDAKRDGALQALLDTVARELEQVRLATDRLHDDQFIDTCADWVVPYIGELVGTRPLHDVPHTPSRRRDVARTLHYRRRKGTVPMLAELGRAVTGWPMRTVEFMELLQWSQNLNHLRGADRAVHLWDRRDPVTWGRVSTALVRDLDLMDRRGGAFDGLAHSADVRTPCPRRGWHNVHNVGFFSWPSASLPWADVRPRRWAKPGEAGNPGWYHVSPAGSVTPLFARPATPEEGAQAAEEDLPGPIRPLALHLDLEACRRAKAEDRETASRYVGPEASLWVRITADPQQAPQQGVLVPPWELVCQELDTWRRPPGHTTYARADGTARDVPVRLGIDVRRGRIAFAAGREPAPGTVHVGFHYGSTGWLGGGPYPRPPPPGAETLLMSVSKHGQGHHRTLGQAFAAWVLAGSPSGRIQVEDNGIYGGDLTLAPPAGCSLAITAAPYAKPILRLVSPLQLAGPAAPGAPAQVRLEGLFVEGALKLSGRLGLEIAHCTFVPGRRTGQEEEPASPDLDTIVAARPGTTDTIHGGSPEQWALEVAVHHSILGPVRLPSEARLTVEDSVVEASPVAGMPQPAIAADDAAMPGPAARIERATILGSTHVRQLHASDCIFTAPVVVERRQVGCVRYSWLPSEGSSTPRRYHCQPDEALQGVKDPARQRRIRRRLAPAFASLRFGDPGYATLGPGCSREVREGAEEGLEMGAFNFLRTPRRADNLRVRLEEYLPFGLRPALIPTDSLGDP